MFKKPELGASFILLRHSSHGQWEGRWPLPLSPTVTFPTAPPPAPLPLPGPLLGCVHPLVTQPREPRHGQGLLRAAAAVQIHTHTLPPGQVSTQSQGCPHLAFLVTLNREDAVGNAGWGRASNESGTKPDFVKLPDCLISEISSHKCRRRPNFPFFPDLS